MLSEKQLLANRQNALRSTGPRSAEGKAIASQNALRHGLRAEHNVIPGEDAEEFESFRHLMLDDLTPAGALEFMLAERIVAGFWKLHRAGRVETALLKELDILPLDSDQKKEKDGMPFKITVTEAIVCPIHGRNLDPGQTPTDCDSCSLTPQPKTQEPKAIAVTASEGDLKSPPQDRDKGGLSLSDKKPGSHFQPPLALGLLFKNDMSHANILARFRLYEGQIERSLYKALTELQKLQILRSSRWMLDPSDEKTQVSTLEP